MPRCRESLAVDNRDLCFMECNRTKNLIMEGSLISLFLRDISYEYLKMVLIEI